MVKSSSSTDNSNDSESNYRWHDIDLQDLWDIKQALYVFGGHRGPFGQLLLNIIRGGLKGVITLLLCEIFEISDGADLEEGCSTKSRVDGGNQHLESNTGFQKTSKGGGEARLRASPGYNIGFPWHARVGRSRASTPQPSHFQATSVDGLPGSPCSSRRLQQCNVLKSHPPIIPLCPF